LDYGPWEVSVSLYRIRTVAELSGVPAATLRAWERRYGVPAPARTASAYRLYSDDDVELIRSMRDLVNGGTAPSEAARVVLAARPAEARPDAAAQDPLEAARDRIVEAAMRFDPEAIELEVRRTLTLGAAVPIFEQALGPALQRVGDLWHEGTLTVAQEHLTSQIVMGAAVELLRLTQPLDTSRRVALACFADEEHSIGLYGVAMRFASWGFRTMILGARTPPAAVGRVVETLEPDVVALSASVALPPPRARELVDAYADACRGVVWTVGGAASEGMKAWVEARGGLAWDGDMSELRRRVERALAGRRHKAAKER
jgi:DNA-binding transcriptional MerR regulator/methylmalonyl-CoA mutase cobalamin-binding subunit